MLDCSPVKRPQAQRSLERASSVPIIDDTPNGHDRLAQPFDPEAHTFKQTAEPTSLRIPVGRRRPGRRGSGRSCGRPAPEPKREERLTLRGRWGHQHALLVRRRVLLPRHLGQRHPPVRHRTSVPLRSRLARLCLGPRSTDGDLQLGI